MERQAFILHKESRFILKKLKVLSLFDGISCGQVALERANIPVETYYASEIDKYAIQVTQKNYPNTIQLGDVTKIDFTQFAGKIDLLIGGSPCFTSNTNILTKNGFKQIKDISINDEVLTNKLRYKRVTNIGNKLANTCILRATGMLDTTTTLNHPYLSVTRRKVWNNKNKEYEYHFSDKKWKQVKDLEKNDYLLIPRIKQEENIYNLTDEECFILGRYIADGHTVKRLRYDGGHNGSRSWQLVLSIGSKKNFETSIHYSLYLHTKNVERMVFSNKRLVEIAEKECGCGSLNKKISVNLLNLPKDKLKILIDGYLSGDGGIKKDNYSITTVSKELVQSLTLAVAKVYGTTGCVAFFKRPKTTIIEGRIVNQHDTYSFSFKKIKTKQCKYYSDSDFIYVPFRKVENTQSKEVVYNITVEDDNSYVANNIVVHNCQDLSIAKRSGKGLEGERSSLFFEYVRALETIEPKYFLLENVASMKNSDKDKISDIIGCEPIMINSALVSAQQRKRYYWTNIPNISQPVDKKIYLKNILEDGCTDRLKSYCVTVTYSRAENLKDYFDFEQRQTIFDKPNRIGQIGKGGQGDRIYSVNGKSVSLSANGGGRGAKTGLYYTELGVRKLTPIECERLQTLPDNYTELGLTYYYKNIYDIINMVIKGEQQCKNVKLKDATNQYLTNKQDYAINIICDLSDMEQQNLQEIQLKERKNVLLKDVIICNKQEMDIALNTIKDLKEQEVLNCKKTNQKNVNIAIEWQLQEECVISTIKIGYDTEMHNIQIKLEKEQINTDIKNLKESIECNIEKLLPKCLVGTLHLKKLYTILIWINLIIIKKIYMFAIKTNTQAYINSLTKLQGNLLNVELSNLKMVNIIPISATQRYKALGNGWTVDVIAHILKGIANEES